MVLNLNSAGDPLESGRRLEGMPGREWDGKEGRRISEGKWRRKVCMCVAWRKGRRRGREGGRVPM
jgi:hypothetical protein